MDRHRRIAHTLGCLVASMTAGAILLTVVQPKSDRPAAPAPAPDLAAYVKHQWQSIQVEPARPDGQIDPEQTHFFVARDGSYSMLKSSPTQNHLGQSGIIRIALQPSARDNRVTEPTEPQWNTTQRLWGFLQRECHIPNRRVVLSPALLVPGGPVRQQAGLRPGGRTKSSSSR